MGGWLQFGRGEVGWERRRRRNRGRECQQMGGYIMVFSDGITYGLFCWCFHRWFRRWQCHVTVRLSQFESLGHSVGKIVWRHHAVAYFQTNYIPRRQNGRYIPTDFETELFPSVIITDEKILSVISLVFSSFLVVLFSQSECFYSCSLILWTIFYI